MGLLGDRIKELIVTRFLRFGKGAVIKVTNADGTVSNVDLTELAALDGIAAADLAKIDGITNGTAAANKAVVLGASKEIATITSATITTLTSTTVNTTTADTTNLEVTNIKAKDGTAAGSIADSTGVVTLTTLAGTTATYPTVNATNIDAGASGTAGTVEVFPATASKGKFKIAAADSAGDTITTITNASQAAARTYTIPDAGADASFVMTEGAQTVNGTKTIPALVTTNMDAGASGTAGTVDIFPTTASKGKLAITKADNTNNDTTTLTVDLHGQATTVHLPDGGAASSYLVQSTAAITLAEADVLDGAVAGTPAASKALVANSAVGVGAFRETARNLRKQAAEAAKTTAVTLTAAEIMAGLITANQGGTAAADYTLPLGSDLETALLAAHPGLANDDSFDWSLINISTVAGEDITVVTNTGWTLVGEMTVEANDADRAQSSGMFRVRRTAANTYTIYRLA